MTSGLDEVGEVQRSLRDLASLLTLPALWVGHDADTVLQMVTEAMERLIPLDMTYADVPLWPEEPPLTRLRFKGLDANEAELAQWSGAIAAMHELVLPSSADVVETPMGSIRVVRVGMRCGAKAASIWFGCTDPAFPTDNNLILLKAAASLAASGMQAAKLDEERRRASRAKDEFLAMLGHELRNPLAPIFAALELIKQQQGHLDATHTVIERQARQMSNLVDDLLDISRVVTGKVQLTKKRLSLRSLVERAVEATQPLILERGHTLDVSLPAEEATILGDRTRLTQVLTNLLTNAAKYTPEHGRIQVRATVRDGTVSIAVRDNGLGIGDELKPRLFKIFEQGESALERGNGGMGIGLALVHNFVTLHDGSVMVDSEGPGCGSTFTVTLPLCTGAHVEVEEPAKVVEANPHSSHGRRVLLVDDNTDSADILSQVLEISGFEVRTASHPKEALSLFETFKPQIVVLDVGLPEMDGFQLARVMKHSQAAADELRLITLSGYGLPEDYKRSKDAGIERHLVKPYDPDALVNLLKQVQ